MVLQRIETKKYTLAIRKFNGSHTAKRIAGFIGQLKLKLYTFITDKLEELICEWEVQDKCHTFVRDSASNMQKGISMIRIWNKTDNKKENAEIKHANCALTS